MPKGDTKKTESAPKNSAKNVAPVRGSPKQKPPIGYLIFGAILLFGSIFLWRFVPTPDQVVIKSADHSSAVRVSIADDSASRAQGLSGVDKLGQNEGKLFVYQEPEIPKFWMKDMKFPIDIIWIDEQYKITGFEQSVQPSSYPTTFSPKTPIKYALEVNADFVSDRKIQVGDYVKLQLN